MSTTTELTAMQWRLLNALDADPTQADTLLAAQSCGRDDLRRLWATKMIDASIPLMGAVDLAAHLDGGGKLNLITVKLSTRGTAAVAQPVNRVLWALHGSRRGSAARVMADTGADTSLLADMVDRGLIAGRYAPTGGQDVPADCLRSYAIPTRHVTLRLTGRGAARLPLI